MSLSMGDMWVNVGTVRIFDTVWCEADFKVWVKWSEVAQADFWVWSEAQKLGVNVWGRVNIYSIMCEQQGRLGRRCKQSTQVIQEENTQWRAAITSYYCQHLLPAIIASIYCQLLLPAFITSYSFQHLLPASLRVIVAFILPGIVTSFCCQFLLTNCRVA